MRISHDRFPSKTSGLSKIKAQPKGLIVTGICSESLKLCQLSECIKGRCCSTLWGKGARNWLWWPGRQKEPCWGFGGELFLGCFFPTLAVWPWAGEDKLPWGSVLCCAQLCSADVVYPFECCTFSICMITSSLGSQEKNANTENRVRAVLAVTWFWYSLPFPMLMEYTVCFGMKSFVSAINLMFVFPSPVWLVHTRGCTLWNWL